MPTSSSSSPWPSPSSRPMSTSGVSMAGVADNQRQGVEVTGNSAEARMVKTIRKRVGMIASHMRQQNSEHRVAVKNTNVIFNQLLDSLDIVADGFKETLATEDVPDTRVFVEVDADRSVGILNVLWHSISFTARGNTKPLAMFRYGLEPVFTGRIVALRGDFLDASNEMSDMDFPEILEYEIASLYVPSDPTSPAVMKVKHLGDKEHFLNQADAAQLFLLKTIEMICGGGFFHENDII